jgi:hypothetical protein
MSTTVLLLDLPRAFSLELTISPDGVLLAAHWCWCDLVLGAAQVGAA